MKIPPIPRQDNVFQFPLQWGHGFSAVTIQAREFLACAKHVERKAYRLLGERRIDKGIHGTTAKLATS